jgi:hypothetical protein
MTSRLSALFDFTFDHNITEKTQHTPDVQSHHNLHGEHVSQHLHSLSEAPAFLLNAQPTTQINIPLRTSSWRLTGSGLPSRSHIKPVSTTHVRAFSLPFIDNQY